MQEWRIIEDGPKDGILNMAIDRAILTSCELGEVPPTLRFYSWERPTLTVGYSQDIDKEIDLERCRELGVSVVRRPTGGRALLHNHEVTYSFTAPIPHPKFPSSLQGAYNVVASALLEGLEQLGVKGAKVAHSKNVDKDEFSFRSSLCLSSLNQWEIEVQQAKLVGSAQRRTNMAFLQHGSILIDCDRVLLNSLFKYRVREYRHRSMNILENKVTTLSECLGKNVARAEVLRAVKKGFSRILPGKWINRSLSPFEKAMCEQKFFTKKSYF